MTAPSATVMSGTVDDISDDELLRRAVANCRGRRFRKGEGHFRWSAVMDTFSLGSGYSAELCRRFGLDPYEMVKR